MALDLGALYYTVEARPNMGQARKQIKDFSNKASRSLKRAANAATSWQSAMGAAAGAAGLGYLINRTLGANQQLQRQADLMGTNIRAVQELQFVSGQLGVTQQNVRDAYKELNIRMQDFIQTGAGPAKDAFKALKLEQKDVQRLSKDTDQAFMRLISRLEKMEKSRAINLADQLFGGQGAEAVISLINQGSDSIRRMRDRARELGLVLDKDVVRQSSRAKEKIDLLVKVLQKQFQRVVGELAPDISKVADNMASWVTNNQKFLKQDLPNHLGAVAQGFSGIGRALGVVVKGTSQASRGLASWIYGPETAKGQIEEKLKSTREQIGLLESKLKGMKQVSNQEQGFLDQLFYGKQSKNISKLQNQLSKLRSQAQIYQKSLNDMKQSTMQVTEADKMLWMQMSKLNDQTQENTQDTNENTNAKNKNASATQDVISRLKDQIKQHQMSSKEYREYQALQEAGVEKYSTEATKIRTLVDRLYELKGAQSNVAQSAERMGNASESAANRMSVSMEHAKKATNEALVTVDELGRKVQQIGTGMGTTTGAQANAMFRYATRDDFSTPTKSYPVPRQGKERKLYYMHEKMTGESLPLQELLKFRKRPGMSPFEYMAGPGGADPNRLMEQGYQPPRDSDYYGRDGGGGNQININMQNNGVNDPTNLADQLEHELIQRMKSGRMREAIQDAASGR